MLVKIVFIAVYGVCARECEEVRETLDVLLYNLLQWDRVSHWSPNQAGSQHAPESLLSFPPKRWAVSACLFHLSACSHTRPFKWGKAFELRSSCSPSNLPSFSWLILGIISYFKFQKIFLCRLQLWDLLVFKSVAITSACSCGFNVCQFSTWMFQD